MPSRPFRPFLLLAALLLSGCDDVADDAAGWDAELAAAVIARHADVLHATYADATARARALQVEVEAFCARPTAAGLERCRAAWVHAREAYQESEVGRFREGPIDRVPDGPEGDINAWPIDESWIDGVEGRPESGIVSDREGRPTIDEATLRAANRAGGEENVATGWHAIEFLLWGEDRSADGPGDRRHTDFLDDGTRPNADRRRRYLALATRMLADDLERVRAEWDPRSGPHRANFLAQPHAQALTAIFGGLGTLAAAELRGERLATPFLSRLQEDEHSCFSDTTHLDHLHDAIGVRNVWLGARAGDAVALADDGHGLRALVAAADAELAAAVDDAIAAVIAAFSDPAVVPFDQAILGSDEAPGRRALQRALDALAALDRALARSARALGLATDRGVAQ